MQILESETQIELHKHKIQDIKDNDTITESYYKLMAALSRKLGMTQQAEIYELAIVQNKKEYYSLLQEVRDKNNWESWILFMLDAIENTSKHVSMSYL